MRNIPGMLAIFVLSASALLSGCNTLADARAAKGTGPSRVYAANQDAVWAALPGVVKSAGLDYVGDNHADGYALAQRGMSAFSYGENVAIFVEAGPRPNSTRVEVDSKRALATNITAKNWESDILDALSAHFPAD